ncbi:MAG: hypothetical protein OXQ92_04960 [Boseongicola sp.]|nr:hypothetical protein [Boseongicola sp.]MDD9977408.1 hypothetical protein [Boseongicola sp.]
MDQGIRAQLQISRTTHINDILRTTIFSFIGLGALIAFTDGLAIPLTVLTITVTVFGILAGNTAIDDVSVLRNDMDEATRASHYGQKAHGRNLEAFKIVSTVLNGAVGLAYLAVIWG